MEKWTAKNESLKQREEAVAVSGVEKKTLFLIRGGVRTKTVTTEGIQRHEMLTK